MVPVKDPPSDPPKPPTVCFKVIDVFVRGNLVANSGAATWPCWKAGAFEAKEEEDLANAEDCVCCCACSATVFARPTSPLRGLKKTILFNRIF